MLSAFTDFADIFDRHGDLQAANLRSPSTSMKSPATGSTTTAAPVPTRTTPRRKRTIGLFEDNGAA
jgi:hypothetical protein